MIKLFEYFEDDTNVYLVMEYLSITLHTSCFYRMCTGGELFDRIIEKEYFSEKYGA